MHSPFSSLVFFMSSVNSLKLLRSIIVVKPPEVQILLCRGQLLHKNICVLGGLTTMIDLCTETSIPHEVHSKIK